MGFERSEGFFKSFDETRLYFQAWHAADAKGSIVITHGQGEYSGAYHRLTEFFQDDAWNFYAWDLRGHGRSEGRRGFVNQFSDYVHDYAAFLELILRSPDRPKGPVILLGHSMGGLIQLRFLVENPDFKAQGQVLSSPALGLALPIPAWKKKGAGLINSLFPQVTLWNEITNDMLTSDLDVIKEFERDPYRHTRISPAAFLGFMESWDIVIPQAGDIHTPTLLQMPENDPVVNTPISKTVFESLGSKWKDIYIYPQARHEIYNDVMRKTVYQDLKHFLDKMLERNT